MALHMAPVMVALLTAGCDNAQMYSDAANGTSMTLHMGL
jgi:hypothetical protein